MKYLLMFLLSLSLTTAYAQYKPFTKQKIIGYSLVAAGSFIDGATDRWGYQGRKTFENCCNAAPRGFFGSQSWKNDKVLFQTWDFEHTTNYMRKGFYIGGGITIGIGGHKVNKKFKHYLYDALITAGISTCSKWAGDKTMIALNRIR